MRIISGSLKSRVIQLPKNFDARPTTDMARESLFNILNNLVDFTDVKFLDLFSGSGFISYEMFSRGCPDITSVEINNRHSAFIKKTAGELNAPVKVVTSDVFRFINQSLFSFELIFADPPFNLKGIDTLPGLILNSKILTPDGLLVLEHPPGINFAGTPGFYDHRKYGHVHFSFFRRPG